MENFTPVSALIVDLMICASAVMVAGVGENEPLPRIRN
jgi:hypothetical protein